MIKKTGNVRLVKYDYNLIYKYVKESYDFAINSFKHFVSLLDLDPNLFKHLYDINIIIDYENNEKYYGTIAFYLSTDNEVHILSDFISDCLDSFKDKNEILIIHNFAQAILHELLHANRDIFINNGINKYRIQEMQTGNIKKYDKYFQRFNSFLDNSDDFQILSIETYDGFSIVNLYYDKGKSFLKFRLDKTFNNFDNPKEIIGNIIKSKYLSKLYNSKLIDICALDEEDFFLNITNYDYNSLKQFNNINDNEIENILNNIDIHDYAEELFVDALSFIIINTCNKDEINLNKTYETLKERNIFEEVKVMLLFYRELGVDFIKWFILSCYEDEYHNFLKDILKDKYNMIINELSNIYEYVKYGTDIKEEDINQLKEHILSLKK